MNPFETEEKLKRLRMLALLAVLGFVGSIVWSIVKGLTTGGIVGACVSVALWVVAAVLIRPLERARGRELTNALNEKVQAQYRQRGGF